MSQAYYNEFDRHAAAWLRELIDAGLIAPGDVDDRSILDVRPADNAFVGDNLQKQKVLHPGRLFAALGRLVLEGRLEHHRLEVRDPHRVPSSNVIATFSASSFRSDASVSARLHSPKGTLWVIRESRRRRGSERHSSASSRSS